MDALTPKNLFPPLRQVEFYSIILFEVDVRCTLIVFPLVRKRQAVSWISDFVAFLFFWRKPYGLN